MDESSKQQQISNAGGPVKSGINRKIIIYAIVAIIILVAAWGILASRQDQRAQSDQLQNNISENNPSENNAGNSQADQQVNQAEPTAPVKEFIMQSFVEIVDGQPKPQFSLKEITVNKGDLVRLKITVTSGAHDFKIDEFNVYADTRLNQEAVVEFTADKAGEFIYYCNKPGHRAAGHWGTLKVIEQ